MENMLKSPMEPDLQLHRKHLWDYFELHANQRIALFRFYTLILGLFITSSGFVLIRMPENKSPFDEYMVAVLCVIFAFLTLIFQLLDGRNRQLIHYSEEMLGDFEKKCLCDESRVFTQEQKEKCNGNNRIGHTACFLTLFIGSYIAAGSLFLFMIYRACHQL